MARMQGAGVDEVARWLVGSVELPQYEQAFRDNQVDGPMLQDLVANKLLGELVESRLHQSRLRSQLAERVDEHATMLRRVRTKCVHRRQFGRALDNLTQGASTVLTLVLRSGGRVRWP